MGFPTATLVMRSLVVSFVVQMVIGTTLASAQTVIVRHATPGTMVTLVLDATQLGTATANREGTATVVAPHTLELPLDVNIWVDICDDVQRVILARPGAQLLPGAGCRRTQITAIGVYFVQRVTTIVVNLQGTPSVLLRQGRAPDAWLRDPPPVVAKPPAAPLPPLTGLTLFGAVGHSATLNFKSQACGDVAACSTSAPIAYSGGVGWWLTDFVAAEARYTYLGIQTADASDDTLSFATSREGGVIAFTGRVGVRSGRLRPFGRIGMGLHRATLTTTQTLNETTVVTDDVTETIPGGTQILQMRTRGWAPVYGGGVEVWLSPSIGLVGEAQRIGLKGADDRGSGIRIDDAAIVLQAGVTVRIP